MYKGIIMEKYISFSSCFEEVSKNSGTVGTNLQCEKFAFFFPGMKA